jgi:hypothetical protein
VRWHRAGFRCYWRWKSRRRGGRPPIEAELRALIRQMSRENLLWGAPRLYGWIAEISFGSTSQPTRQRSGLHVKSRKHFLGMRVRTTSSATATGSMAASSHAGCVPWASGTGLPHQPRPGRMAERLIGPIRRECVDHIIVLGEAHLRRILKSYARYCNATRTPISRLVQRTGVVSHLPSSADFTTTLRV